jgi:CRISPR-associated protein Cas2
MARIRYLVSYDISSPRRLRKVAKTCEAFGSRLQFSVFECPLDSKRLQQLRAALDAIIHHEEDQILFISLGPSANDASLCIDAMGVPYVQRSRITII